MDDEVYVRPPCNLRQEGVIDQIWRTQRKSWRVPCRHLDNLTCVSLNIWDATSWARRNTSNSCNLIGTLGEA
eukprot:7301581-Heterocapsa_arctica.AAC.1